MPEQKKSLSEHIADQINEMPEYYAAKLVDAFAKADPTALKTVTAALEELKYQDEEKLKITDEQIKNIVILAAGRISPAKPA